MTFIDCRVTNVARASVDDAQGVHDALAAEGVEIVRPLGPSPFGQHFAFRDLDGYVVTVHDAQQS